MASVNVSVINAKSALSVPRLNLQADSQNNLLRRVNLTSGLVITFAGSPTQDFGFVDGTGIAALFNNPRGVAMDGTGAYAVMVGFTSENSRYARARVPCVFLFWSYQAAVPFPRRHRSQADTNNNLIRRVTIVAPATATQTRSLSPSATQSSTCSPSASVTPSSTLSQLQIVTTWNMTTLAGETSSGYAGGTGTMALFYGLTGIAMNGAGTIAVVVR